MRWMIEMRDGRAGVLLKAADPVKDGGLRRGVEDALDELGSAIVAHGRPASTAAARRRWSATPRGVAAIGAAVLVLAGGATAATQLLGSGQLREAAPNFCRKALALSEGAVRGHSLSAGVLQLAIVGTGERRGSAGQDAGTVRL